ncbi:MAG TPA: hypothetical protein VM305_01130 [Candidatus Limnocylindrales bacterium]|nr:hypothetical protein [Candidatus Limnocylindrales bacterium]
MTEEERKPRSAEPTPELPESGADLEPRSQPLAHDEPAETHGHDHEPAVGDIPADGHASHGASDTHGDVHDAGQGAEHEEARVGPIDWAAWGYALIGVAVALVVIAAFWVAAYQPF